MIDCNVISAGIPVKANVPVFRARLLALPCYIHSACCVHAIKPFSIGSCHGQNLKPRPHTHTHIHTHTHTYIHIYYMLYISYMLCILYILPLCIVTYISTHIYRIYKGASACLVAEEGRDEEGQAIDNEEADFLRGGVASLLHAYGTCWATS